jgi:hypothetical protein
MHRNIRAVLVTIVGVAVVMAFTEVPELRRLLLTMGFRPPAGNPMNSSQPLSDGS